MKSWSSPLLSEEREEEEDEEHDDESEEKAETGETTASIVEMPSEEMMGVGAAGEVAPDQYSGGSSG